MNCYIYGYGNRTKELLDNKKFQYYICQKYNIEIVGIIDRDKTKSGCKVFINSLEIEIKDKIDLNEEWIIVSQYDYSEIYNSFIAEGIDPSRLIILSEEITAYQNELIGVGCCKEKIGIEIGGPSDIFEPIYNICKSCDCVNFSATNTWTEYDNNEYVVNNRILGEVIIKDATDLSSISELTYDFVLSSNNLEHIANPLKALKEFVRITKHIGYVMIVVPKKDKTFDHNREYTTIEHIIEDFEKEIGEDDLTHLDEIIEKHDYDMDPGCNGKENFVIRSKHNYDNRCLHHHVFSIPVLEKMMDICGLKAVKSGYLESNYYIIGQKN